MSSEERASLLIPRGNEHEPNTENIINEEPHHYDALRRHHRYHYYKYGHGGHHLVLSVLLTLLCCSCGAWWTLICTVPAIFYSIAAQEAEKERDDEKAERVIYSAIQFNLFAVLSFIVAVSIIFIVLLIHYSLNL
ncbi:PREDICTED: uncharacterized protein LOC109582009 [Amphimedon queenslandica]|uniref:Uncharacterized protein n=2 Tax=Amphimedon queenslandica TaxID=400682 RepID=A0AAN0J5Y1_AMPQE|nr:PREDICTED: uncharacterized protein LOC109582009 [Amphimedon queenslandica]|eukprot:XP_019852116.1 PREDICTED: uncharacterized protein LOC109582009 [Amphimedon queenslandica]